MPRTQGCVRHIGIALSACLLLGATAQASAFQPGDVFWGAGACNSPCGAFEVTGGGGLDVSALLAPMTELPGQIAWVEASAELYVSEFGLDRIAAISATGSVTTFASGIDGATGLIRTADGRILAASFRDGSVLDVTAGGDFSAAIPFATGLARPRNLLRRANGQILVADQSRGRVVDITGGGDFDLDPGYAFGFASGPFDLVEDAAGRVLASSFEGVFEVTAGGDVSIAAPFASGREFMGMTLDAQGRLLAAVFDSSEILDISAGGDFTGAPPFAWGLPGFGDTALDAIPAAGGGGQAIPVPATDGTGLLLLALLLAAAARPGLRSRQRA